MSCEVAEQYDLDWHLQDAVHLALELPEFRFYQTWNKHDPKTGMSLSYWLAVIGWILAELHPNLRQTGELFPEPGIR
jgi:hypothetical protein